VPQNIERSKLPTQALRHAALQMPVDGVLDRRELPF
jgi:hypothetical protein